VQIAVVTGNHGFPEPEFDAVFDGMEYVEFTREDLVQFVADPNRLRFETVVFYNYHQGSPDPATQEALLGLAAAGRGIVVIHHALLAYPEWPEWRNICGIDPVYNGTHDQTLPVHVADPNHPIAAGLADFDIVDEAFRMGVLYADRHVLLTVDHASSMHDLAWTGTYQNSRVFCIQSGHDERAFGTTGYRTVLDRAVRWTAQR
jgi:type 1 glutamine amidotransferase